MTNSYSQNGVKAGLYISQNLKGIEIELKMAMECSNLKEVNGKLTKIRISRSLCITAP